MGGVGLGAGSDLTLNFDGNKLLDIRVDAGVANALASNGGLLKADGGESRWRPGPPMRCSTRW